MPKWNSFIQNSGYIPSTGIPLNTWKQMKFLGTLLNSTSSKGIDFNPFHQVEFN
jgi:hypothetical protein